MYTALEISFGDGRYWPRHLNVLPDGNYAFIGACNDHWFAIDVAGNVFGSPSSVMQDAETLEMPEPEREMLIAFARLGTAMKYATKKAPAPPKRDRGLVLGGV
jgi:hypothetical protein